MLKYYPSLKVLVRNHPSLRLVKTNYDRIILFYEKEVISVIKVITLVQVNILLLTELFRQPSP